MGRTICVTGHFDVLDRNGFPTGVKEFVVSHGIDEDTGRNVILQCVPPAQLGAKYDADLHEWVIPEDDPNERPQRMRG